MINKKISTILDEGRDNKVLVQWIDVTAYENDDDIEVEIEYSIHTKGEGHTEENHSLVWGSYFDSLERAKGTFQYYSHDGENFRNIVKEVKKIADIFDNDSSCWIEHDWPLEILSICNGNEDEVYTFQGDGYRELEREYENSCLDSFVCFEDYIKYTSQDW